MSQSKMLKRWTPRYFVLDNGYLSHFEKKSLVGTKKKKVRSAVFACNYTALRIVMCKQQYCVAFVSVCSCVYHTSPLPPPPPLLVVFLFFWRPWCLTNRENDTS